MKSILSFLLFVSLSVALNAQEAVTHYSISGGLLGDANLSEFRTSNGVDYKTKLNWGIGGFVNFPVTSSFSIEPQLQYNSLQFQTRSTSSTLLLKDGKIRYISIPLLFKFNVGDHFAFDLGPQVDFRNSLEDNNNVVEKTAVKKTNFNLFAGIELMPRSRVTIFGRYIWGLTNVDNRATHPETNEYKIQNIQVGLKFRLFGGHKETSSYKATTITTPPPPPAPVDSDGDGIMDDVDKCPNQKGFARYNGCPIPDTDNDGINDEEDKCPTVAGITRYNGCPIPDSDNDGINDEEDKCPTVAGPKERNGCPVTDRDNDGVNDENDKCPDIAGSAANSGCPDVPANVSKSIGVLSPGITFGTGSSVKLNTSSNVSLNKLVNIMNENPALKIRLEGHTSNTGNADANMTLSENRANAVKDYLVKKGISADRITVEGYGGTQPIADNKTAAGKKKNTRVEIRMNYY